MSKKIKLKIKKEHPLAVLPKYAHDGDACMDLTAVTERYVEEDGFGFIEYGTGLSFQIPENHVLLIYPRSSISNTGLILANSVGCLDFGYLGELKVRFKYVKGGVKYNVGDRVAQFLVIPRPLVQLEEVQEFSNNSSNRNSLGFGSTGK